MADPKNPPSFKDAIADASQAIAGSIGSPDYDPKFAGMIMDVFHKFITSGGKPGGPGSPPSAAGVATPPAGGPGAPSPDQGSPSPGAGAPGGVGGPTSDTGSGPPGGGAQTPPSAPTPGGMTQGLTPSPDELRRVLSDVAGK